MTELVIDCSVTMAWCFPDEASDEADRALNVLTDGEAHVPELWALEVANVVAIGERRGRLTADDSTKFLDSLNALPIVVDRETSDRAFGSILLLARAHQITAYDAAYLELSIRRSLPLATLDDRLKAVAGGLGIELFAP